MSPSYLRLFAFTSAVYLAACSTPTNGEDSEPDTIVIGDSAGGDAGLDGGDDVFVPAVCESNVDCAGGEVCRGGVCVESCGPDDPCSGLLPICDEESGFCVGCLDDTDCVGGLVCDSDAQLCVEPECREDDDCAGGFTCEEGVCLSIDDIVCSSLTSRCDGDVVYACNRDGTREDATPCAEDETCVEDGAEASCLLRVCTPEELTCVDDVTAGLCNATGTGFDLFACREDQYCEAGVCEERICEPDERTCDGDVAVVCDGRGSAATSTACIETCESAEFGCACVEGDCVDRVCVPESTQCVGNASRTCNALGTAWLPLSDCGDEALCLAGVCLDLLCEPGTVECAGESVVTCGSDGTSRDVEDCGADGRLCAPSGGGAACFERVCEPLAARCAAGRETVLTCDARGTGETERACEADEYCSAGACLPRVCAPGGPLCREGNVQQCNTRGSAWELVDDCLDVGCEDGACAFACGDPDIEVNACGGCTELPLLGDACGPCSLDEYVCNGTDAVVCDGATRANACGGCVPLPLLGTACGPCGRDEYVCNGANAVVCDGSTADNECGGCTALPLLGTACGPCFLDEYVCGGTDSAVCGGATACGVGALGSACSTDADCASGSCSDESDATANDRCVPRLLAGTATQIDFSYVPAGSFTMGSPSGEVGDRGTNEAQVSVTLSNALVVMRTEVTQGQWKRVPGSTNPSAFAVCGDSCPVNLVDWYSAAAYANWLTATDGDGGTSPCYALTPSTCADDLADWADGDTDCTGATFTGVSCTGYRLLTEAEWEYAARAGTTTATYWNGTTSRPTGGNLQTPFDLCETQPNLTPIAVYCDIESSTIRPAASLAPNAWGLFDMLGNVDEWTTDWYLASLPGGTNPLHPAGSLTRSHRGGSWADSAGRVRAAFRDRSLAETRLGAIGFRVARTLP